MTPRITASTPPSDWPLLLTLREVALVLGRSFRAMQNDCSAGTMWPPPVTTTEGSYQKPYRWDRDQLERYITGRLKRPPSYRPRNRRAA